MFSFKCINCRSEQYSAVLVSKEFAVNDKTLVIENIPVQQCDNCNERYYDKTANEYIDEQIQIFEAEGFQNNSKAIAKAKGLTQEQIGEMLGVTKQRVSQILNTDNIDMRTANKISNILNEPIYNVYRFRKITNKDNKFYIENQ